MYASVLYNDDCNKVLCTLPDNSIDLVIIDPPYEITTGGSGGCFGYENKPHLAEVCRNKDFNSGISNDVLDELTRILKKINIYIWCNKEQLQQYINYFKNKNCFVDLLVWCKTNPVPTCNNKYLSDIEYLIFAREKGVKIYGSYNTKHKFYVTPVNKDDKKKYKHPTIKPLNIIENLIINSSKESDVVLDCFMGTGTTGVACKKLNRLFVGIEINKEYFNTAIKRIEETNEKEEENNDTNR